MSDKEAWKDELYGDDVREKLFEFADAGFDAIPEAERDQWFSRFKFWGVFHHRPGQEGYCMVRLTNCGGVLAPGQLRRIGELARDYARGPTDNPEFGNGWIDLTTRQSVQLHWIDFEDVPAVLTALEDAGLTTRSAGGDTMRNISGCPVAGKDAHEYVDTRPLLERLQTDLRGDNALANLPRKFNISVTGCREGCAQDAINDVALEPARKLTDGDEVRGFNVRVGGGLGGREPRKARPLDIFVTPDQGYEIVRSFVELYHEEGDRTNRNKNRARFFVDDWGTDAIREELAERVSFALQPAGTSFRSGYTYNAGTSGPGKHDHVGVHEQADGTYYVGCSVPVGRLPAAEVIEFADLAAEYGSGEVRLTRRQNPLIMDVPEDNLDALLAEPLLDVHSPAPDVFTRGAMACTGTEFCSLALTETKTRMAVMLRWLREHVDVPDDVDELKLHFSGCTADCGQALTADIGLQGMRARKDGEMVEAMDVGVGGGLGADPAFIDWVRQRVPADEVPGMLRNLIEAYAALREPNQSFRDWVADTGHESIVELAEPAETSYDDPCLHDAKDAWYPFAAAPADGAGGDASADD